MADIDTVGALTWDGTTVNLYRDGALVYTGAQVGQVLPAAPVSVHALNIAGGDFNWSNARIYEAGGINRVLTASEIAAVSSELQRTFS